MPVNYRSLAIDWLGGATIRLETGDTVVYFDPGRFGILDGTWEPWGLAAEDSHPSVGDFRPNDGDVICLSTLQYYDPAAIERVAKPAAEIIAFDGINTHHSERDLPRLAELKYDISWVGIEDETLVEGMPLWTVPAYLDTEPPDTQFPVLSKGEGCGFLLAIDCIRLFWPGLTSVLEGHGKLDVDIFCPPIGGGLTMDSDAALALAIELQPDLVVPVHYNTFPGIEADSEAFATAIAKSAIPVALAENQTQTCG